MKKAQSILIGVYVAIYLRLSRDDQNGSAESMSIINQREMLIAYCEERGWKIYDIYIDDGFTGTNFERPGFQRMIEDIKSGNINVVLTKDLSRLGRNYVMTGQYTDFFFPEHGVRYVAVNDSYDSEKDDNDIAPFKNILNEMYAKDICCDHFQSGRKCVLMFTEQFVIWRRMIYERTGAKRFKRMVHVLKKHIRFCTGGQN